MAFCGMLSKCGLIYSHCMFHNSERQRDTVSLRYSKQDAHILADQPEIAIWRSQAQRYYSIFGSWQTQSVRRVKTQFLHRELSTIFTVEYFLEVILSIYRFKKDCFPFKDGIQHSWSQKLICLATHILNILKILAWQNLCLNPRKTH